MLRRAFALLVGTLGLAACTYPPGVAPGYPPGYPVGLVPGPQPVAAAGQVAVLLPLTGPRADIGQAMLKAAQLALDAPGAPRLDPHDTTGSPQGAATAAREAIAAGDSMILGPLTSAETAAVAPIARQVGIPVLAFTNDPAQAQPGVWPLGITPRQQVFRLVAAAQGEGRSQFAGLLPDTEFGRAMAGALQEATATAGLPPPRLQDYSKGMASINAAVRDLSDYAARGGTLDARMRALREQRDADSRREARELAQQRGAIPPPPFEALLLADTGESLSEIASLLPYYDIPASSVRVIGPALWANPSSGAGQLPGAWYAAPDPMARTAFADAYAAKYGGPPPAIADLAYDAASVARVLGRNPGAQGGLTQSAGFAGSDGLFALLPDGQVRRGLAVFEVQRGGSPQMVAPAPQALDVPGT